MPLETFRAPQATGADPASRAALRHQPLQPDRNLGGYLQQPPAMLTTLGAIPYFVNSRTIAGNEQQLTAPVSAIMIRVSGVTGIDALSRARVAAVATSIHQMFPRLTLDVTLGSSPQAQTIALPAGVAACCDRVIALHDGRVASDDVMGGEVAGTVLFDRIGRLRFDG